MATRPHRPTPPRRAILAVLPALAFSLALSTSATAQPTHLAQDWAQPPAGFVPQDSLRDHLTRLRAALLALKDSPEIAQPLVLRAHVTAEGRSGVRRLQIRNFQFLSDGPPAVGEFNLGPGSWPTVVGVLGSAVAEEFLTQAALKGIPLDELEIVFTGRPSAGPASSGGSRVTYPRNLAYTAYIVSPAADAELEELRATVERVSPVLRLVTEPQPIAHGTLVLTPTPAERGAKTLEGLREFLAGKYAASRGARPYPPIPVGPRRDPAEPPLRADIKVEAGTGIRHIRTDDGNFQIIHDSPRALAGHNLGPVAEEHILGVMITCLTHIYEIQAASQQVALDSLALEVEGTLTPRLGSTTTRPSFSNIHYTVRIGSPEPKERIEQLQRAVEATCPIYNMLKDAQPIKGAIARGPYRGPERAPSP